MFRNLTFSNSIFKFYLISAVINSDLFFLKDVLDLWNKEIRNKAFGSWENQTMEEATKIAPKWDINVDHGEICELQTRQWPSDKLRVRKLFGRVSFFQFYIAPF